MKSIKQFILLAASLLFVVIYSSAQCSTTINFDVWLNASQSANQNQDLSGAVTSITFQLDFYGPGGEWPADMIVIIYSPNGNCVGGEGYNINPPSTCYDINFPPNWTTTANGYYTYTMYLPDNYLSGDGTWYFTVQNGWTIAGNTNYDLDIILNGICDQAGCTNEWACNYDPDATVSDNSLCIYPDFGYDCDGNCIVDSDGDGICDVFEVPGCTDMAACNFTSTATDEDDTCFYPEPNEDCSGNSLLPTFNNAPVNITSSCANVSEPTTVYATISPFASDFEETYNPNGNCYAATWTVEVSMTEEFIPGSCPGNYQLLRHYTGTDCMGRQCFYTQQVDVVDNTPPEFTSGLETQTTSCPIQVNFVNAGAEDSCSEPLNVFIGEEEILSGTCDGEYTLYRTVTVTDACGNSSTAEQSIIVVDDTPPIWDVLIPEQIISDEIENGDFGTPTAVDLCSNATVSVESEIGPGNCPLAVELTKTFIATDDCGNISEEFVQVINETTDLISNISSTVDASCWYSNDGAVTIETVGGVGPYDTDFGNLDPNSLYVGNYEVTVTDDNLCAAVLEFSIGSPPALQLSLESTIPECLEQNSGTIIANAAGGSGELTIDWNGIDPNAVAAGEYSVDVYDENGCMLSEEVVVDAAIIPIDGDLDGETEVLLGDSSVYEYDFTVGSTYEWTFGGADSLVVSDIFAISLLWTTEGGGFVCVQETNSNGCVGDQVCIEVNVNVGIDELGNNDSILIYPNPNSGDFSCSIPNITGLKPWRLFDMRGTEIKSGISNSNLSNIYDFNFPDLISGNYILLIESKAVPVVIEK
ncbi:MAG: hypothetical protein CL847_02380 [Crocinitomicaceae bacterium]|nr:hypothetical protein [Crocinitomicaceae bacterium]|tara:strand:- start:2554 stop:4992 length:2439 start_codon:yes stop_codon:yes gene_type:complete